MSTRTRGSSLIEVLISLAAGTLVLGACCLMCHQFQTGSVALQRLISRSRSVWLAPILLDNWISSAGSGSDSVLQNGIEIQDGRLTVHSDLTGFQGFPDGSLDDSFESVSLRANTGALQLRSGNGTFQPSLDNLRQIQFHQAAGNSLDITLEFSGGGHPAPYPARIESVHLFLWNQDERGTGQGEEP